MSNIVKHQATNQKNFDSDQLAEMLFTRLKEIFPAFRASLSDPEIERGTIKQWAVGLAENGCLNVDSIQRGLKKARLYNSPFLPSVGQFISWCQPTEQDLGLPTEQEALRQALNVNSKKHPATIFTLSKLDTHALRHSSTADCYRMWGRAWVETISHVKAGGNLPATIEEEKRIERIPLSEQEISEHLAKLRAIAGVR